MSLLFAATYPERARALVLYASFAVIRRLRTRRSCSAILNRSKASGAPGNRNTLKGLAEDVHLSAAVDVALASGAA